jgi:hypothetical protein
VPYLKEKNQGIKKERIPYKKLMLMIFLLRFGLENPLFFLLLPTSTSYVIGLGK